MDEFQMNCSYACTREKKYVHLASVSEVERACMIKPDILEGMGKFGAEIR
jgi:hypothetical protein